MSRLGKHGGRIRLPFRESLRLVVSYARSRVGAQVPSVAFIAAYLVLFQVVVLDSTPGDALVLSVGLVTVVLGLAFFLEGLFLGLMPLGETIGGKLPKRAPFALVLAFAFVLGVGASLAEPAIGALKIAGSTVKAWEAPLLFLLLNKGTGMLVGAIGLGVGLAVVLGVFRFYYNWSLKPLVVVIFGILLPLTVAAWLVPGVGSAIGMAWDCGGIVTGPVTVPLVLALGLGISRGLGTGESGLSGFGVVTLASALPIITVIGLGLMLSPGVPVPQPAANFAAPEQRAAAISLFDSEDEFLAYMVAKGGPDARLAAFGGDFSSMMAHFRRLDADPAARCGRFPAEARGFERWLAQQGTAAEQEAFFGSAAAAAAARVRLFADPPRVDVAGSLASIGLASLQAVLPLCLFLLVTLGVFLRERLPRPDEVYFGVILAVVGMFLLSAGIEYGLARLGNTVGGSLPAAIKAIDLPDETRVIPNFSEDLVFRSIDAQGQERRFFYLRQGGRTIEAEFDPARFHADTGTYDLIPQRGPLLGPGNGDAGLIVLVLFSLVLGAAAAMAEPTLATMGKAVEEITVGILKKSHLMAAVAAGIGVGIAFGVLKIVADIPLVWLLVPPYLLALGLSMVSDESYVCIAWDSAGAATGPVTVPLVLAIGVSLGTQVGVIEGFGVLALASVWPIVVVLGMGLVLKRRQLREIRAVENGSEA